MSDFVETELGKLPKKWTVTTVEKLIQEEILAKPLDGNHGNIHPKGSDLVDEGIPFIMASDVTNGKVDLVNCKFISKEQADSLQKGFSIAGDVLLTHKASLGRTAIVQDNPYPYIMLTPQVTYYRVLDSNRLNNRFLKYYFDSPVFQGTLVNHGDSGSTRSYVGITAQRDLPIIYPPIGTQLSISILLASLDDKIDLLHRQNETLENMAQTLFRQWFVEEAEESWENLKLEDVCEIRNGYAFKSKDYKESGHVIVRTKDFENGYIDLKDPVFLDEQLIENYARFQLERTELLLVMVGASLGKTVVVTKDILPALQNQNMWAFKAHDNELQFYLNYAVKKLIDENLYSASGSARSFFQKGSFYKFSIKIPPKDLSIRANLYFENHLEKIELNKKQIKSLEQLRNALLPKLMSGKVRVKN